MGKCRNCGSISRIISQKAGFCLNCIRSNFENIKADVQKTHQETRRMFGLPASAPKNGIKCDMCINNCHIPHGETGFCGVRANVDGKIEGGVSSAIVSWYFDPLPTNCVADWVCPGGTGCGYPKYSYSRGGPEFGYKSMAVFYYGCSFNCLFCQNWSHKDVKRQRAVSAQALAKCVDEKTSCICYFGGDPTPQIAHSIMVSQLARKQNPNRILRICWETNGSMNQNALRQIINISLESGGCVKFDLKAFSEDLHLFLTDVSNRRTLENFAIAAEEAIKHKSRGIPLVVASTLLVPGYVDKEEVYNIARYIASFDTSIPYRLLAFHPQFMMSDLPTTSQNHARECYQAAKEAGLKNISIGNLHLLIEKDY